MSGIFAIITILEKNFVWFLIAFSCLYPILTCVLGRCI